MAVQTPPAGYQRIIPNLLYGNAAASIDFLVRAFGFRERMRMASPGGQVPVRSFR